MKRFQQGRSGFSSKLLQVIPRRAVLNKTSCRLSTLETPVVPALSPKQVGAVVSRRQWNKLYKPQPRKPPPKDPLDDKPWPRSVQILGYALLTTVVPYSIAWYIATNVTIRNFLDPYLPGMVPALRKWFGEPEENSVSYVDKREEAGKLVMPKSLDMEWPSHVRKEQEAIEELVKTHLVPTRVRVFTRGGFNLGDIVDLPGNLPATKEALLEILMKGRDRRIDMQDVSHISVEFSDAKDGNNALSAEQNDVELHTPFASEETSINNSLLLQGNPATLIKSTGIYSSWHYQPSIKNASVETQKQQAVVTNDDIRINQLEFELEQLEKELKNHTTMRSFDDIKEDIKRNKSELRGLRWKRRLRFFGC